MIFFKKRLKPLWTFKSERKVWRLLVEKGILIAELRDTEKKTAGFAGIDLSSGSRLWKNDQLEEKWWINLNVIYRDSVLLQQFARPDMPTPGRIFALDLYTGKLLWENSEVSFINAAGEILFCSKKTFTSETVIGLNFRTGIEEAISQSEVPDKYFSSHSELILPEAIDELQDDAQGPDTRLDIIRQKIPSDARQTMILRIGEINVGGFHIPSGKDPKGTMVYDAHIIVMDAQGKIIFEDIVDRNVYVPLADFYFGTGEN